MLVHNRENKMVRIQRIDPYLANGQIKIRRSAMGEVLVDQMMMFPLAGYHDDGPDALEMAIRLIQHHAVTRTPAGIHIVHS